jgi:hypothetical protein
VQNVPVITFTLNFGLVINSGFSPASYITDLMYAAIDAEDEVSTP